MRTGYCSIQHSWYIQIVVSLRLLYAYLWTATAATIAKSILSIYSSFQDLDFITTPGEKLRI